MSFFGPHISRRSCDPSSAGCPLPQPEVIQLSSDRPAQEVGVEEVARLLARGADITLRLEDEVPNKECLACSRVFKASSPAGAVAVKVHFDRCGFGDDTAIEMLEESEYRILRLANCAALPGFTQAVAEVRGSDGKLAAFAHTWQEGRQLDEVFRSGTPTRQEVCRALGELTRRWEAGGLRLWDSNPTNFILLPDGRYVCIDPGAVTTVQEGQRLSQPIVEALCTAN